MTEILLSDDLSGLRDGAVYFDVDPYKEFHAVADPPDANADGWRTQIGHWSIPKELWFKVTDSSGRGWLESRRPTTAYDNLLMTKGDRDWHDYVLEADVVLLPAAPDAWGGPRGLVFRHVDTQRYYAFALDADGCFKLLKRVESNWDVLASSPPVQASEAPTRLHVRVEGSALSCAAPDLGVRLEAVDHEYGSGSVGVIGASPVRIGGLTVSALPGESERLAAVKDASAKMLREKRARYPKPRLWKKIETSGFGGYRTYRFGDLSGDGKTDILLGQRAADRTTACLTAINLDGEILWQVGKPLADYPRHTGDIPAQIHDVNGDGRNEVVCACGREVQILNGATGEVLNRCPAPEALPVPSYYKEISNHWGGLWGDEEERLVIDAIAFADLKGAGRRSDILVKDNYHHISAFDADLNLLWSHLNPQGHYPLPFDVNGDGREEVIAGYSLLSPEGKCLWSLCLQDHQDAIYAGRLTEDQSGPLRILMSAGEDGLLYMDATGNLGQRVMGHVQRLGLGKFSAEIPGLQVAICLFHGNPGIISLFDANLRKLWTRELPVAGATLHPVNWDGTGTELIFYTGARPAMGFAGGMLDAAGDLVVEMPDDGGPGETWDILPLEDADGDPRDKIVVWDPERIWIYAPDGALPGGPVYRPLRPPRSCASNYQAYYSHPKWDG